MTKPAHYDDVRPFRRADGWERKADAAVRSVGKHEVRAKALRDGTVPRTVISEGRGAHEPSTTAHMIEHGLRVTESKLWAAVREGAPPQRPEPRPRTATDETLPLSLVRAALATGFAAEDVRTPTLADAGRLLKRR